MEKLSQNDLTIRILALVKLDAQRLYERIKFRAPEYLTIYSNKRSRDHFAAVFKNRFDDITIEDLKYCNEGVIHALDGFYSAVDNLRWYLYTTEDMPIKVDKRVHNSLKELSKLFNNVFEAIDIQRGIVNKQNQASQNVAKSKVNQVSFEELKLDNKKENKPGFNPIKKSELKETTRAGVFDEDDSPIRFNADIDLISREENRRKKREEESITANMQTKVIPELVSENEIKQEIQNSNNPSNENKTVIVENTDIDLLSRNKTVLELDEEDDASELELHFDMGDDEDVTVVRKPVKFEEEDDEEEGVKFDLDP